MSALISCQNLSKRHGTRSIFANVSFGVHSKDRLGIIGANGSGKSTLLSMLAGVDTPDEGEVVVKTGTRISLVKQDSAFEPGLLVENILTQRLQTLQMDVVETQRELSKLLTLGQFQDGRQEACKLSGGWQKRLAIVVGLAGDPDVLLLDEPTNHLDYEGIGWLEQLLLRLEKTFVVVSHDRYFLERVANRIGDVSPVYSGGMLMAEGAYADFLGQKANYFAAQAKVEASLANRVRREEEWLRRGPKARTTKSKSRTDQAHAMQDELVALRQRRQVAQASIAFTATERRTKRLLEAKDLSKTLGERLLFKDVSLVLSPQVRLGVLGMNGSGKSTMLQILAERLQPDQGEVKSADQLRVAYFEQTRQIKNPQWPLKRALAPEGDSVIFGDRSLHVVSWAKRFGFRPDQLDVPVERLSGGEKARVLIAQLMSEPADVLFLDEPTNDLDIPTLETLEESLMEFPGAVVIISHDRYLLERVCTVTGGLDGQGAWEVFADFSQWEEWFQLRKKELSQASKQKHPKDHNPSRQLSEPAGQIKKKTKRLSYMEQREWDGMEQAIADAEAALDVCRIALENPSIMANSVKLTEASGQMDKAQAKVDQLYERWAELEEKLK